MLTALPAKLNHEVDGGPRRRGDDALRTATLDLIYMNVQMPEMDGLGTIRHVRAEWPATEQTTGDALTAAATEQGRGRCRAVGRDVFLANRFGGLAEVLNQDGHSASPDGEE